MTVGPELRVTAWSQLHVAGEGSAVAVRADQAAHRLEKPLAVLLDALSFLRGDVVLDCQGRETPDGLGEPHKALLGERGSARGAEQSVGCRRAHREELGPKGCWDAPLPRHVCHQLREQRLQPPSPGASRRLPRGDE